jgi:hypothetical protein
MILEIPKIIDNETPANPADWAADEGDTHIVFKRESYAESFHLEMINVCITGLHRLRVAGEFKNLYGEPYSVDTDTASDPPTDHISWLIVD